MKLHEGFDNICKQPFTLGISGEMSNQMSSEDQVEVLKEEITYLSEALAHCINIVNDMQRDLSDCIQYMDNRIKVIHHEIEEHTNNFHSMLIIGNNEKEKDKNIDT